MIDKSLLGGCKETWYAQNDAGYASTVWNGKTIAHHRLIWCLARGLDPSEIEGMVVRHICDNPSCINVNHLELGTLGDNNRDRAERGRSDDRHGSKHPLSKLTEDTVKKIREEGKCLKQKSLALRYNVSKATICMILNRKTWTHI